MNERQYHLPALAACLVAAGYPLLMIVDAARISLSGWDSLTWSGPGFSDFVFLALGGLSIVAYLGFRSWLRERLNYDRLDLPLLVLAGLLGLFHGTLFLLSLLGWVASDEAVGVLAVAAWVGFTVLFGIVDLVIAILLIRDHKQLPGLLMPLAIVTGLLGLLELSVILALGTLVLVPLVMVLMALCLVYRPDYLEVV
ncbi:MAG: hypothetical protein V2I57_05200 [Xanthomonadales bacterium]|jgi:hypothetical protein|nr:hypothetical protein [Xanthomonadales bacterium]